MRHTMVVLLTMATGCGGSSVDPSAADAGATEAGAMDAGVATAEFRLGGTYDASLRWSAGSGSCSQAVEAETDEVIVTADTVILRRGNANFPNGCPIVLQRQGTDVDAGGGALQVHATGNGSACTFHFGAASDQTAPELVVNLVSADVTLRRNVDNTRVATMHLIWSVPPGTAVCGNGGHGGMLTETTDAP